MRKYQDIYAGMKTYIVHTQGAVYIRQICTKISVGNSQSYLTTIVYTQTYREDSIIII